MGICYHALTNIESSFHSYNIYLHNIQTQTTTVSSLQLVSGQYRAVTSDIVLCVSLTRWQVLRHCLHQQSSGHILS